MNVSLLRSRAATLCILLQLFIGFRVSIQHKLQIQGSKRSLYVDDATVVIQGQKGGVREEVANRST